MKKFLFVSALSLVLCSAICGCTVKNIQPIEPNDNSGKAYSVNDDMGKACSIEIDGVPVIGQMPELPTGCEATSAAMLLQWAGVDTNKVDVANNIKKGHVPVLKNGKLYGPNPNNVFVGDPFSNFGYGTFHKPIADVINMYLEDKACDVTGASIDDLYKILNSGRPVIVWATIHMVEPKVSKIWYDENGDKVTWMIPEHALLLVGYTQAHVIVHDPYTGNKEHYSKSVFESVWKAMGSQAVTIWANKNG
ncbi:MAG TPA: hypothetical protein DD426_13840 [Clostridiaceae bacterium]|nr:hypothetical protein [Clostridiaceae bacterium]